MVKKNGLDSRNSLILKIAAFLNFISKKNYNKILQDIKQHPEEKKIDLLKLMLAKKYIAPADLQTLKKTVLNFAKSQEDTRFGKLAIEFRFLTQSNLNLALEEQKKLEKNGSSIMIGDLLVEAGMLSERQRNLILQKQKIEGMGRTSQEESSKNSNDDLKKDQKTGEVDTDKIDLSKMRQIKEPEITFYIREDGLAAYMKKAKDFDPGMIAADLKILLEKIGLIYGIADDDDLTNFINLPKYKEAVFEVARGVEPIDGEDAHIVYMFERDYLKAGSLSEDGTMDFKDRGEIPFVNQGDVLAEKIPVREGKDGVDIYGDVIPQREPEDIAFNIGKGVHLSRDELKVVADSEGNPKVDKNDEISVNSAYMIEGDVDYTTGHIKFDKNVFIAGSIKSGFRVEAIDVVAKTIDGGIVKAQGDIFIQSGITESTLEAKGNIKAAYLHNSKAKCMGDLNIYKEIVDTDILIEGTLNVGKGKIISSTISAKGGAKVYAIGSEKAKPSSITVGTSHYYDKEMVAIDADIDRHQMVLEEATLRKSNLEMEIAAINEKLRDFEQSKERTLTMVETFKNSNDMEKIQIFQKSIDETMDKIKDHKSRKQLLEAKFKKAKIDITTHSEVVKARIKRKFSLKRMNQANPSRAVLEIYNKAFAGTKITGKHSHMYLGEDISRSKILEMDSSPEESMRSNWEMIITSL